MVRLGVVARRAGEGTAMTQSDDFVDVEDWEDWDHIREDCEDVAHSREDVPWLIAEVERLRAENEELHLIAREMAGYVKSFGLGDYGPDSEWAKWKRCSDRLATLKENHG
jgi:ribosomal protein S18 acetylase RimI-like enzyme